MSRVTLVVNNFDEGSETFLHSLARQLVEIGHELTVHVLLEGRTAMRTGESFDIPGVRRSSALPAVRSPGFLSAALRLLFRRPRTVVDSVRRSFGTFGRGRRAAHAAAVAAPLLATRPDVVHVAFSGIGVAIQDALDLLDPGTRLVVSCRGSGELVAPELDPSIRPRLAALFDRSDAVQVVSDAVGDVVRSLSPHDVPVHVIRPAVDTSSSGGPSRERRHGPLRVITVARLHWIKAVEMQIAAAVQLVEQGLDLRWTVVGDGPDRAELELITRLAGVGSTMTFIGGVPAAQVRRLVAEADVLVSSSWSEGTSNSVLEAMALGVPVVSSSAGGMPEVLVDGVDSLVFPVGDANSLANAVRVLAEDPARAAAMAEQARRKVRERFSVERQRIEWARLYTEVLAGAAGRSR